QGCRILDLGSGTGRMPLLLQHLSEKITAVDLNYPMLEEQKIQQNVFPQKWPLINADMRFLPFPSNSADVITAGWAIGHLRGWYEHDWKDQICKILREMKRVVVNKGTLIIMETLSTGSLKPQPPTAGLGELYQWFEREWGFSKKKISTDYLFENLEDAINKTEFFFGPELTQLIRKHNWVRLPEWTGIWSMKVEK
ncbi:MAG: class I SAM-dependent methyltransferase, partial [Anaerolineaceae bacterium]|nr:class I SAM-dependent methyltransferase [Anaerolineaceae bacterium]